MLVGSKPLAQRGKRRARDVRACSAPALESGVWLLIHGFDGQGGGDRVQDWLQNQRLPSRSPI
jgi:hypothetical protein